MTIFRTPVLRSSTSVLLLCTASLYAATIMADDQKQALFSVKGFGSLIGTGTDTRSIGFRRDVSRSQGTTETWNIVNDSRFGLQLDAHFTDELQATVQWIAKDHTGNFLEQNLDWAFLRWRAQPDLDIRIGRLGVDVFMLSDYRNVGYAYPWIRPPHEFYANIPFYHLDGVDIAKKYEIGGGYLTLKAFAGYSKTDLPTELGIIYHQESLNFGGNIQFEKEEWRFKAGYAHLEMTAEIPSLNQQISSVNNPFIKQLWPGLDHTLSLLPIKGKEANFASLGASYDDGTWLAQAEASYIATNTLWYPDQASAYLSIGRRFSNVTLYTLGGIAKSLTATIPVPKPLGNIPFLNEKWQELDYNINYNNVDEKSIGLGLRWDFYANMAFKAQWNHVWLNPYNSDRTWIKSSTNVVSPETANVFSVGIDFMF